MDNGRSRRPGVAQAVPSAALSRSINGGAVTGFRSRAHQPGAVIRTRGGNPDETRSLKCKPLEIGMPDDQFLAPSDALLLDPPVGVPEPAPLEMPRRQIRRLPVDLFRLLPRSASVGRTTEGSRAG